MATPTRLLWSNECMVSGVTITSSAEVTNYPDDNVANKARWKIWRSSTTTGDQWIKFDFGANKTLKALFVAGHKIHTGGILKIQAHATDSWATPTVDETITPASFNPTGVEGAFFSSQSLRWVRVFFDNDGSANEFVELGCVFAGAYLEPTGYQIRERFDIQRLDPSSIVRALDGQEEAQQRQKFYRVAGEFPFEPEADKDSFQTAFDTVGASVPFWLAISPTDADLQFYGRFEEALNTSHKQLKSGSSWSIPFSFMESR